MPVAHKIAAPPEEKVILPEFKTEDAGPCKKKISVTIPAARVKQVFDKTFKEISTTVQFPGFRIGHTPKTLVEKRFGKHIQGQVKEELVGESFEKALEEYHLTPVGDPDFALPPVDQPLTENDTLAYSVVLEVRPTVTLPDYSDIKIKAREIRVTEKEIKEALNDLRQQKARLEVVPDAKVEKEDYLVADVTLESAGKVWHEEKNVTLHLPWGKVLAIPIDGLDRLVGQQSGSSHTFLVTVPTTHQPKEWAGQAAELHVTLQEIKRFRLPEATEEWAKSLDCDSLADLQEELKKNVTRHQEQLAHQEQENEIIGKILDRTKFDLPEGLVEKEMQQAIKHHRRELQLKGLQDAATDKELEKSEKERREAARQELRRYFLLEEIARSERIFATEDEVTAHIEKIAASYGKWPQEIRDYNEKNHRLPELRHQIRVAKTLTLLREKAAK